MAKIALRAYNQEIDSLIEARQIDEAIAHCRHILKTFPKHIQTYRLLGKAFLESQRYGDAADILQRVLSSIPDDFIAHVGMSVIREDEGNLAEAIYHMERAFEVQPANRAIQEELRRLYGKRDGFEPPKVRLSRGALARMYAKGELYPQAVAELRAALAENPERLDLRLLLARNYLRMGQRVEAADACNFLLRKLPYCLEANQIMAEVLQNSERAADATAYRRRVAALDPYEAHVSALMPDAGRVPDGTVTVERLAWQPGMPMVAGDYQPEWAASLGVQVPEEYPGLDEFPDWLGGDKGPVEKKAALHGPALVGEDGVTPLKAEDEAPGGEIPDWMQKAGWKPGSGEEPGEAPEYEDETEDLLAGIEELTGLPAADLPDWVREMAPAEEKSEEPGGEGRNEWVSETEMEADSGAEELGELLEGTQVGGEPPEWLSELEEAEGKDLHAAETAILATDETRSLGPRPVEEEMPDWLKDLAPQTLEAPEAPESVETPAEVAGIEEIPQAAKAAEAIPDWLSEAGPVEKEAADEVTDWLAEAGAQAPEEAAVTEEGLPDWLQNAPGVEIAAETEGIPAAGEPAVEAGVAEGGEDLDAALAWLEGLAAKQGADEALFTSPDERPEAPPDWVRQTTEDEGIQPFEMAEAAAEAAPAEEIPDWLQEAKVEAEESMAEVAAPAEEIPDWLQEAKVEAEESMAEVAAPAEEIPDWLKDAAAASAAGAAAGVAGVDASATRSLGEAGEGEAAEGEAAAQLPDWLQEAKSEVEEAGEEAVAPAGEIPEWLPEVKEELSAVEEAPLTELPNLMQEAQATAEEPQFVEEAEAATETAAEEAIEAEEIPDWLKEMKAEAGEEIPMEEAAPAEEMPDWLREMKAEAPEPAGEETAAAAWAYDSVAYDTVASETAVSEPGEAEAPTAAAEEAEMLPDWLKSFSADEAAGAGLAGAAAATMANEWQIEEQPEPAAEIQPEAAAAEDWLAALETPVEEGDTKPGRTMLADHLDYERLGIEPAVEAPDETVEMPPAEAMLAEELPDWLREMAPPSEVEAEAETPGAALGEDEFAKLFVEPEDIVAKTPDWSLAGETPEEEALETAEAEEIEKELLAEEVVPQATAAQAAEEEAFMALFTEAETAAVETPDWMQAEEAVEAAVAETEEAPLAVEETASEAEELGETAAEAVEPESAEIEAPLEEEAAAPELETTPEAEVQAPSIDISAEAAEMPDFGDDMEAAFAWLEGLAAKQGAQEALLTSPEERPEAPPEWVAKSVEEIPPVESVAEIPSAAEEALEEALPAFVEDETSAVSLETGLEAELEAEPAAEPAALPAALPDEIEAAVETEAPAAAAELEGELEGALEEALPAFVEDETSAVSLETEFEAELPEAEAPVPAVEAEALDLEEAWKGVEDFVPVAEEAEEAAAATIPEMPAWLQEAEQVKAEAKPELPDWLQEVEETGEKALAEMAAEMKPELPAWLEEVEQAEAGAAPEAEAWTPPEMPVVEAAKPEPVNLNKAGLVDLERLPGIGFTMAQKILDQRDQTGPFNSVMDLGQIPGITPDILAELEGLVTVEAPKPAVTAPHLRAEGPDDLLAARQTLLNGDIDGGLDQYSKLIRQRRFLQDILRDLQQAVEANPRQPEFWQALGDAYLRDDQVQEALEAYTKVEELLR